MTRYFRLHSRLFDISRWVTESGKYIEYLLRVNAAIKNIGTWRRHKCSKKTLSLGILVPVNRLIMTRAISQVTKSKMYEITESNDLPWPTSPSFIIRCDRNVKLWLLFPHTQKSFPQINRPDILLRRKLWPYHSPKCVRRTIEWILKLVTANVTLLPIKISNQTMWT